MVTWNQMKEKSKQQTILERKVENDAEKCRDKCADKRDESYKKVLKGRKELLALSMKYNKEQAAKKK